MTTRMGVDATVVYDPARIRERYGLEASQMIDFKSLKGDSTDNIPGVPGVGDKTAAKLVSQFGSLDALYEHLDEVTPEKLREKLREHHDRVLASRELVTIHRDLPVALDLDAARFGEYDRDEVVRLFREYEFRTLIDRLPPLRGATGAQEGAAETPAPGGSDPAVPGMAPIRAPGPAAAVRPSFGSPGARVAAAPRPGSGDGLQLALDFDSVGQIGEAAGVIRPAPAPLPSGDLRGALALLLSDPDRVELVGEAEIPALAEWLAGRSAVGAALVLDDPRPRQGHALALGVAGEDGRIIATDGPAASDALRRALEDARVPLVAHEVKPLLVAQLAEDPAAVPTPVAFDTQIAAYLLNASLRSQAIADVVAERLDLVLPPTAAGLAPPARAGLEALAALAVREPLADALREASLDRLFAELELPLIPILARMEATGVAIDRAALGLLDVEFAGELARLEAEIFADVGHEFTLGSPKQLEQVLFYELNLPKGRRTKTGFSTDATVLEDLRAAHPAVAKLLDWRLYSKLRSTYIAALPELLADDGRLHTTFHQAVAATGRLSSSDPNLQNIPIRTPLGRRIRRAIVAGAPDVTLVAADYSQIELRILAHVSGDAHLREAFLAGADIHRDTAALVLHKDPADITPDERSMAKMVNFGIAYGMSDFGLSSRANIPRAEAKAFIDRYFATYSGISYYMLHIKETARQQGFVTTLLGRRREIPELRATNPSLRGAGERMAINMPIQGTAADIMKIAMIRVDRRLRAEGFHSRLLLQVHDELLLEVPRDEVARLVPVLRDTMEGALVLDVPLTVDVKTGDDWESMTVVPRDTGA
jgi:DNA polymerase-1